VNDGLVINGTKYPYSSGPINGRITITVDDPKEDPKEAKGDGEK